MARQVERRERTRATLIDAAAGCFERMGFAETSLDAVLRAAGVSKGALYHYFGSKNDLLEAVFQGVSQQVLKEAGSASAACETPREALSHALKSWLRTALKPRPRRILLEIGPAILGFAKARKIELAQSEGVMLKLIKRVVANGDRTCANPLLTARLLNAAVTEMALNAMDQELDHTRLGEFDIAIDILIDALIPRNPASSADDDTGSVPFSI